MIVRIMIKGYNPKYFLKLGIVEQYLNEGNLLVKMQDGQTIGIHENYVRILRR